MDEMTLGLAVHIARHVDVFPRTDLERALVRLAGELSRLETAHLEAARLELEAARLEEARLALE